MPPPVTLPDSLDPMTRAQLAQVIEARDSGTPIRSYRSIEKVCGVTEARAVVLWGIWREVSPFVFGVAQPITITVDAADPVVVVGRVEPDGSIVAIVPAPEPTPAPEDLTHAEPIPEPAAEVPDVRIGGDASGTSASVEPDAEVRGHLVIRGPDHLPSVAGGDPPDVLPGLRPAPPVKAGKGRPVKLDEDQWHGAAATLAAIVEGVTQRPAGMMDPTSGRGRQLAEVGTAIGWSRMRARLDAVALAARGQPTLPAAVACWRQIQQDGPGRVAMLLRVDGARLLTDLDAEAEDLAAGRMTLAREAPRQVARTTGGRDDGERSVTADDVRAVLARRGYRARDEITVEEVADG